MPPKSIRKISAGPPPNATERRTIRLVIGLCSVWLMFIMSLAVTVAPVTAQPKGQQELVLSYHPRATQIGLETLQSGGNAVDAFVAATMAEYVLAEGGTSMAGQVGALVYDANKRMVEYLDAGYNNVGQPNGIWKKDNDPLGKTFPVPGAVAGLEALVDRYGTKKFADLIEPAAVLARDGFPITSFYATMIAWRAQELRHSDYFQKTYMPEGKALQAGDTLRQPEVAAFLAALQEQGSAYMYRGQWAKQLVQTVGERGGLMTANDLASYQAAWHKPLKASYRNVEIYTSSGRNLGGVWTLLALKALEHVDIRKLGHFSESADALEIVVRTARETWAESWIFDYRRLDDRKFVDSRVTSEYAAQIWSRVARALPKRPVTKKGSHSYHIIVIDKQGNAVTGTNTYQQTLPWGAGIFVQGIFLPDLRLSLAYPVEVPPGSRRMDGVTMHMVLERGALRFASGTIADSILEASYQYLVNLIDYQMNAEEAVSSPGFGTFPHDMSFSGMEWTSNWLSPRIDPSIVDILKKRGLNFRQEGPLVGTGVDSGLGGVAIVHPDGTVEGETAPWPGLTNR
jgi:gamma-glutamyltranspeptidase / glutathione hydrolase